MKLEIHNSNPIVENSVLAIPKYKLSEPSLKRRIGTSERFGKPGSYLTGDRKFSGRNATLQGDLHDTTDPGFLLQISNLIKILDERFNPYYLVDTDNLRRIEFELERFNFNVKPGLEKRLEPFSMSIFLPETAWEDTTETEEESGSGGLDTGESLIVKNTGQIESSPVIELEPFASNSAFTIFNNTTEDLITIGSNNFVPGITMEIDAIEGTIYLDNGTTRTEISTSISDGTGFFPLAIGDNVLEYESAFGKVNMTIKFRNRYLF